jgi:prenyl protein peptidase
VVLCSVNDDGPIVSIYLALHKLGYFPIGLLESAKCLLLTAILFLGPLFEAGIAEGKWRGWIRAKGLGTSVRGWIGYRNYVAVCPFEILHNMPSYRNAVLT